MKRPVIGSRESTRRTADRLALASGGATKPKAIDPAALEELRRRLEADRAQGELLCAGLARLSGHCTVPIVILVVGIGFTLLWGGPVQVLDLGPVALVPPVLALASYLMARCVAWDRTALHALRVLRRRSTRRG